MAGVDENEDAGVCGVVAFEEVDEEGEFFFVCGVETVFGDLVQHDAFGFNFNLLGVVHMLVG